MSAKTLIIASAALAASTVMTLPALAAGGDGTGPAAPPPAATQTVPLRAEILFNLLDVNHDGAVDQQEFTALSNAIFNALDKNHDGKLTPDELRSDFPRLAQRFGQGGPGMGPGRNWQDRFDGRGQGPMNDWRGRGMFNRMNFNGTGPQQGAGPGAGLNFTSLDTNHDGAISLDEFVAHLPVPGQGPGPQQP